MVKNNDFTMAFRNWGGHVPWAQYHLTHMPVECRLHTVYHFSL